MEKTYVVAVLSSALTGIVGYFIGNKKGKDSIEDGIISEICRFLKKKGYDIRETPIEKIFKEYLKELNAIESEKENLDEIANIYLKYDRAIQKYTKPSISDLSSIKRNNDYELTVSEEFIDEEQKEENEEESVNMNNGRKEVYPDPYLITLEEFLDDNGYEKLQLYFYKIDEIICLDDDDVIENPEDYIGWDFYKELEKNKSAYVRNEEASADYEIRALAKSFEEDVINRPETDVERHKRRVARNEKAKEARKKNDHI